MARLGFLCLFLIIFMLEVPAQTRTKKSVAYEYYPGGNVRKEVRTKVTTNVYMEPRKYYKRTVLDICEYYENGRISHHIHKIRQLGEAWRPYYELLSDEQYFSPEGIIQSTHTSRCDRSKVVHREFDAKGMLIYKSVAKPW